MKPRILLYALIGVLFVGGIALLVIDNMVIGEPYEAPPPAPTLPPVQAAVTKAPEPGATAAPPTPTPPPPTDLADPVHIFFTDHEISAPIVPVGRRSNDDMEAPNSATKVGWFEEGVSPGEAGNALLDGHDRWGGLGTFSVLKETSVGEEVVIEYADGTYRYFEVVSVDTFLASEVPEWVMDLHTDIEPRMTLITCLGDYNSRGRSKSRVIVVCRDVTLAVPANG